MTDDVGESGAQRRAHLGVLAVFGEHADELRDAFRSVGQRQKELCEAFCRRGGK